MKKDKIIMKAYELIFAAYSANLGSDGMPENDEVSGNLAEAMATLDQVI